MNTKVTLTCASADDRFDPRILNNGESMSWRFMPNIFGRTLYWCEAKVSDGRYKHWDVYHGMGSGVNWYLRNDGIYNGDQKQISW